MRVGEKYVKMFNRFWVVHYRFIKLTGYFPIEIERILFIEMLDLPFIRFIGRKEGY